MPAYKTTPAPHLRSASSVPRRSWRTVAALVPALGAAFFWFRWDALRIVSGSIFAALAAELLSVWVFRKKTAFYNGSTMLAALLFSMLMPPGIPFWMAALGSSAALFFGKEIFGGLGANPFHPALLGAAFLWIGFPEGMNQYKEPLTGVLTKAPSHFPGQEFPLPALFLGNFAGTIGGTGAAAALAGGWALIWKKQADWKPPLLFLGAVFLFSQILGLDPWKNVLCGGTFLAAFFFIPDSVTTPMTLKGNAVFALGAALLTALLRRARVPFDAIPFAVLFMNALTPWLDEWIRPRRASAPMPNK